jgi:hypothetical protein
MLHHVRSFFAKSFSFIASTGSILLRAKRPFPRQKNVKARFRTAEREAPGQDHFVAGTLAGVSST